jgi:hypothetical protein
MWIAWLILLLVFIKYTYRFYSNSKSHDPYMTEYEPPKDINPMLCGFLLDKRLHIRDILAGIIFLHQKKIINFNKESPRKMLINHKKIESAEYEITKMAFAKGYLKYPSERGSIVYTIILLLLVGTGLYILLQQIEIGLLDFSFFERYVYLASLPVFAWLARIIYKASQIAYTETGVRLRNSISGFKKYISIAEKDRLSFHNSIKEQPESFDYYLAYAIALDVNLEWLPEYTLLIREPPDWYQIKFFATLPAVFYNGNKLSLLEVINLVEYYS